MRKKGTAAEWERLRNVAANMLDGGMRPAAVAPLLGVAAQTVRAWARAYAGGGRAALASGKASGRPPRLTADQKGRLASMLASGPAGQGFPGRYLWTQQLIADLIDREFGVRYHHDHVGVILAAIGVTHQKPMRRARERDEARIAEFRDEAWPALLKKAATPAG